MSFISTNDYRQKKKKRKMKIETKGNEMMRKCCSSSPANSYGYINILPPKFTEGKGIPKKMCITVKLQNNPQSFAQCILSSALPRIVSDLYTN